MATQTQEASARTELKLEHQKTSEAKQTAEKGVKSLQAFWTKITNDWVMNFAAGLALNLITAIFPIAIALIAIAGLIFGSFDPSFNKCNCSGPSAYRSCPPIIPPLPYNEGPLQAAAARGGYALGARAGVGEYEPA